MKIDNLYKRNTIKLHSLLFIGSSNLKESAATVIIIFIRMNRTSGTVDADSYGALRFGNTQHG